MKQTELKSIILIIYFSDVLKIEDGPFQFIKGSHKYSHKYQDLNSRSKNSKDFRNINVEKEFGEKIKESNYLLGIKLVGEFMG